MYFGRLARRPKCSVSYVFLIALMYFGRLARRPKELVKFPRMQKLISLHTHEGKPEAAKLAAEQERITAYVSDGSSETP